MKSLLKTTSILLLIFSFFSAEVFGQCTPDNTHTDFGAYSTLGKNKIPSAWVDSAYNEILTIVIPSTFQGFTINQVTLKEVPDLYTGLDYVCNPPNCVYPGGANGCILIKDTATDNKQTNQKTVTLKLFVESSLADFDTVIHVEFDLLDSAFLSINTRNQIQHNVFPNPAQSTITIDIAKHLYHTISVELVDLNGKMVKEQSFNSSEANIQIPIENIENGIYILKYAIDDKVLFKKITIQH